MSKKCTKRQNPYAVWLSKIHPNRLWKTEKTVGKWRFPLREQTFVVEISVESVENSMAISTENISMLNCQSEIQVKLYISAFR